MAGVDVQTLAKHPSLRHTALTIITVTTRGYKRGTCVCFWGRGGARQGTLYTAPSPVGCTTRVIPSQRTIAKVSTPAPRTPIHLFVLYPARRPFPPPFALPPPGTRSTQPLQVHHHCTDTHPLLLHLYISRSVSCVCGRWEGVGAAKPSLPPKSKDCNSRSYLRLLFFFLS